MADDFEKAILFQFDQSSAASAALKTQAASYLENLKTEPDSWKHFIERFSASPHLEVKFWCLQAIIETVPRRHPSLSADEKSALHQVILTWIRDPGIYHQPPLIRNKLAQVITGIVRLEYPKLRPSFFSDLISALEHGLGAADLFCRIFIAIDTDIISQDMHRSVQDQKISVQLKDAMRESCIKEVVDAWYNLVVMYYSTEPELTGLVLSTLQRFMPLLFELLKVQNDELQEAAIDCLTEILLKGMEPSEKIHFIQKMGVVPCCASWKAGLPGSEGDELREKCAKLLATLCTEILECCKRIENSCISLRACKLDIKSSVKAEANQICSTCESMMEELFPAVMAVLMTNEDPVLTAIVPYLNSFVLRLKHFQERVKILPEKEKLILKRIMQGVLLAARYPNESIISPSGQYSSTGQNSAANEEIEAVSNKRGELFTIFKNIVRIDSELVIQILQIELQRTLQNTQAPFQDVEILLTAIFELGEACTAFMQQPGCGPLAALVLPLIQSNVPNARHQIISIALLELYGRFHKVPILNQHGLPSVLSAFVGAQGIQHTSQSVSDRACYLFMRFVKFSRGSIKAFVSGLLDSLKSFFVSTLKTPRQQTKNEQTISDPRLYAFEAAGLLLGIEDLDPSQQTDGLLAIAYPALQQIEGILNDGLGDDFSKEILLVQSLEAVNRLSKGFKTDQVTQDRTGLGQVFLKSLQLALQLPGYTKSTLVYIRVVSFLHRMVELLGNDTLMYLQNAFDVLLQQQEIDVCQIVELVTLLHQLVTHFKGEFVPLLELIIPTIFQRVWMCLGADWDWSGSKQWASREPGKSLVGQGVLLDETRDKTNLQRLYYGLICAVFVHESGQVFLKIPSDCLQATLESIQKGAGGHVDIPTRRLCIQILTHLVQNWQEQIQNDGNLRQFVMTKIGFEICLARILESDLDHRDAATNTLFQDVALCLKSIASICSNEFLEVLSVQFRNSSFPPEMSVELLTLIQNAYVKELKDFIKRMLTILRTK
eukprot:g4104.t1